MSESYLDAIVARKRREVQRRLRFQACWQQQVAQMPPLPEILSLRQGEVPGIIAEIKFRSPSKGFLRAKQPGDGVRLAQGFEANGAVAISVLADAPGFAGSSLEVRRISEAVVVPTLFKEFVLHEVQLWQARAMGASLVLLILRILDDATVERLIRTARRLGLQPLLEAADEDEVRRSLRTDARFIGINARDLRTFREDHEQAARCINGVPSTREAIWFSGIRSVEQLRLALSTRPSALLIGEGLMRAELPPAKLRELRDELQLEHA